LHRGTRRSKLVHTLPLLVYTSVFGKRRRRQCRRVGVFFRFFGFISVLIFFSLRGFRYSGGQISRKRPFFCKKRKGNEELVVLQMDNSEK
jgi:hypothetical protein